MKKLTSKRPACFEFVLNFLGDPEATELLNYIESLESPTTLKVHKMTQEPRFGILIINDHKISWVKEFNTETGEPILTDSSIELREYTLLDACIAEGNVIKTKNNQFVHIVSLDCD
jgi:hypothetical protein